MLHYYLLKHKFKLIDNQIGYTIRLFKPQRILIISGVFQMFFVKINGIIGNDIISIPALPFLI